MKQGTVLAGIARRGGQVGMVDPVSGTGLRLSVMEAVVIGGASLIGGSAAFFAPSSGPRASLPLLISERHLPWPFDMPSQHKIWNWLICRGQPLAR